MDLRRHTIAKALCHLRVSKTQSIGVVDLSDQFFLEGVILNRCWDCFVQRVCTLENQEILLDSVGSEGEDSAIFEERRSHCRTTAGASGSPLQYRPASRQIHFAAKPMQRCEQDRPLLLPHAAGQPAPSPAQQGGGHARAPSTISTGGAASGAGCVRAQRPSAHVRGSDQRPRKLGYHARRPRRPHSGGAARAAHRDSREGASRFSAARRCPC